MKKTLKDLRKTDLTSNMNKVSFRAKNIKRLSVRKRVIAGLVVIMLEFSGLTFYSISLHLRASANIEFINEVYLPLTLATKEIRSTQRVFNTLMDRLPDDSNQLVTREWLNAARKYRPTTLKKMNFLILEKTGQNIPAIEAMFLNEMRLRLLEVAKRYLGNEHEFHKLYSLMDTGKIEKARVHVEKLKRIERHLDRVLAGIGNEFSSHITDLADEVDNDGTFAAWVLGFLTVAALLIALIIIISVKKLLEPLKTLMHAVEQVAGGNLATQIEVKRSDEIGILADGFNKMTKSLTLREAELKRSEQLAAAGKMAAQVTHEIRNPLSSMGLNVELLEEDLLTKSGVKDSKALLIAIKSEIERLTEITESYLEFAKLPAPKMKTCKLEDVVEGAISFMKEEFEKHNIQVSVSVDNAVTPFKFDKNQIRQALLNLAQNSIAAMNKGGNLDIKMTKQDEWVKLTISDTGTGIPKDNIAQIFELFFSASNNGTGLGLPLVKQICRSHGGDVHCVRTSESGSTFVLSLPA